MCRHQRVISNTRGSSFSLCGRSKTDPRFPKYPRVPVVSCPGFEAEAPEPAARLSVRVGLSYTGPPDGLLPFAEQAEAQGFDSLWLVDSPRLGALAPLPALAAVGARTERLKLGTNVLVLPPRNPLALAREMAAVDALSAGRLLPAGGLGADLPAERQALGVRREDRVARMEECVAVLRRLWTGQPVTHAGRFYELDGITLSPAPSKPRLELWLGGRAPAALRRIGRIADGWLGSFVGPEELGRGVELIRASAREAGRTIDEDHYGTSIFAAPSADEIDGPLAALLARGRPELRREDHVTTSLDELRTLLWRFREQGATKFVLLPAARDPHAWLERLREVVEPFEEEA